MVASMNVVASARHLSHDEADALSHRALHHHFGRTVVIDLNDVEEATTSAFARLVLLRRTLLSRGRDLRLAGLHDRPESLYHVNRLDDVLPLESE